MLVVRSAGDNLHYPVRQVYDNQLREYYNDIPDWMSKEVMNLRISILPKTSLGKWLVNLAAACIILVVLVVVMAGLSVAKPGSLGAWIPGIAFNISGIVALVTGVISIIKTNERSILAFLAGGGNGSFHFV